MRLELLRAFLVKLDELDELLDELPPMDEWVYRQMSRDIEDMRQACMKQLGTIERELIGLV